MQLAPAAVVEVGDIAAFHPDVLAERGQAPKRIAIGRADGDRVRLGDPQLANRLDHEVPSFGTLVRGHHEVLIPGIEREADVEAPSASLRMKATVPVTRRQAASSCRRAGW